MRDDIGTRIPSHNWKRWFAWKPVTTIHGERRWLKTISRRYVAGSYIYR